MNHTNDTPETDSNIEDLSGCTLPSGGSMQHHEMVSADFARKLERELTALRNKDESAIPAPPAGFAYFGKGPIPSAAEKRQKDDVAMFVYSHGEWSTGWSGEGECDHYAIRSGSALADLNGV